MVPSYAYSFCMLESNGVEMYDLLVYGAFTVSLWCVVLFISNFNALQIECHFLSWFLLAYSIVALLAMHIC